MDSSPNVDTSWCDKFTLKKILQTLPDDGSNDSVNAISDSAPGQWAAEQFTDLVLWRIRKPIKRLHKEQPVDQKLWGDTLAALEDVILRLWDEPESAFTFIRCRQGLVDYLLERGEPYKISLDASVHGHFDQLLRDTAKTIAELREANTPELSQINRIGILRTLELALIVIEKLNRAASGLKANQQRQNSESSKQHAGQRSGPRKVFVGMCGTGKTQFALKLNSISDSRRWAFDAWLNASTRNILIDELVKLGERLGVEYRKSLTQYQRARRCIDALASSEYEERLIVLDNVDQIGRIADLIPYGPGVSLVATTRRRSGWQEHGWDLLPVGTFSREESIRLILSETGDDDRESANKLAQELGDLPLAVKQAASHIKFNGWTIKYYVDLLMQETLDKAIELHDDSIYPDHVVPAVLKAIERALSGLTADERNIARQQIGALSMLSDAGVPRQYLSFPGSDTDQAAEALGTLVDLSICDLSDDMKVSLNRIVSRIVRENWSRQDLVEAASLALKSPEDPA